MNPRSIAAAALALGFGVVTYTAIIVEPAMGFETLPADFFDPVKVAAGYASTAWAVENYLYLSLPIAIWILAAPSDDVHRVWSGVVAGVLLFIVGAIDRVGILLPSLVNGDEALRVSLMAMLPVRFALLKTFVFAMGVFAWRTTREGRGGGVVDRAWRGLGYVMLAVGTAFIFALVPAPLAILVWALALAVQETRTPASA